MSVMPSISLLQNVSVSAPRNSCFSWTTFSTALLSGGGKWLAIICDKPILPILCRYTRFGTGKTEGVSFDEGYWWIGVGKTGHHFFISATLPQALE